MSAELTNLVDGVPERFDPKSMRGDLVEAEHLARYAWAGALVAGRRVLDAGCGLGYGAAALARAGADRVVGVDIAEAVVEAARALAGPEIEFQVGDVHALGFPDASFDAVVCFEVIEHVDERDAVLSELKRVLAPGGIALISSPNRDVYVPGNPHHVHEYRPDELREHLRQHFAEVELRRQHNWIASAILDDEAFAEDGGRPIENLRAGKTLAASPGDETYTIAIASDQALPDTPRSLMITGTVELRRWLELYEEQQHILWRQNEHIEGLNDQTKEREELRRQLREAERETAHIVELEQERDEAKGIAYQRQREVDGLLQQIRDLDIRRTEAETALRVVTRSPSWRITAPLRRLKRLLR